MLDWLIILKTIKNELADQVLFHRSFVSLLFMELNQF